MPVFNLTYTVTMPRATQAPEKFRTKIEAANESEAKVKLHRFVQDRVQTSFLACELVKLATAEKSAEILEDVSDMLRMMDQMENIRKKYGFEKPGK